MMNLFNRQGERHVFFDSIKCLTCNTSKSNQNCKKCVENMNMDLYKGLKKLNQKADKVLIIATNLEGQKGFQVVDLDERVLERVLNLAKDCTIKIYKNGTKISMHVRTQSDRQGVIWELKPRVNQIKVWSNVNSQLAELWADEYARREKV